MDRTKCPYIFDQTPYFFDRTIKMTIGVLVNITKVINIKKTCQTTSYSANSNNSIRVLIMYYNFK